MTGFPAPGRMAGATLPQQILSQVAVVPDGGGHVGELAAQARYSVERWYGLPTNDPWIVAAMLAACMHIEYLAQEAAEAGGITEHEAHIVGAIAMQAASIWKRVLFELGAVPAPPEAN